MTKREQQIYRWICENPMISQEEIAQRGGITRSSVGVHISNLMKKGYLAGKGYILSQPDYYVVLGGSNIDIGARPFASLKEADSNPGEIFTSLGGVGRNIAHNMSLLDMPIRFISVFGDDEYANIHIKSLKKLGIDITSSLFLKNQASSFYMFIENNRGEMQYAVNDMHLFDKMNLDFIREKLPIINGAKALIMDTNVNDNIFNFLTSHCKCPIIIDPVSCVKSERLIPYISRIHTICPNRIEAEVLAEMPINDDAAVEAAAEKLISKGVQRVCLTLGKRGAYFADKNEHFFITSKATDIRNTTGAGDSMTAAVALAYDLGLNLRDTAELCMTVSAMTCASSQTVNENITRDEVLKQAHIHMKEGKI